MAFCSQCGSALPEGARYCPKCGKEAENLADASIATLATPDASPVAPPAVPEAAPTVTAPPPVTPPASGGGAKWILPVVIVVALAVIGLMLWSQRDGARPIAGGGETAGVVAPGEAPTAELGEDAAPGRSPGGDTLATTAGSLDSAFNADPQGARERYAGPLTVTGTIATMVSPGPTPSLSLEGRTRFNFVLANLPSGSGAMLASLRKGDRVTLSCRGVDQLAGTTILQDCALT